MSRARNDGWRWQFRHVGLNQLRIGEETYGAERFPSVTLLSQPQLTFPFIA